MSDRDYSRGRIGYSASYYERGHGPSGLGHCFRCRTSWAFVHGHATEYENGQACFPLCEECWAELRPEERLPFYRVLWEQWQSDVRFALSGNDRDSELQRLDQWPAIERAVLSEGAGVPPTP